MLIGRLQHLQRMGLASQPQTGAWVIHVEAEPTLRAIGERGDIIRTMQRAMGGTQRELAVFESGGDGSAIVGRVAAKGRSEEHTSELQSLMRISYAVFCLKKKTKHIHTQ